MDSLNKHKSMKNTSIGASIGAILLIVVGFLAMLAGAWVYGVFAYGFVLAKIWGWFMVAEPFSLPAITWIQAAALFCVIRFITSPHSIKINSKDERETADKIAEVIVPFFAPWATLFFAWLFKIVFM